MLPDMQSMVLKKSGGHRCAARLPALQQLHRCWGRRCTGVQCVDSGTHCMWGLCCAARWQPTLPAAEPSGAQQCTDLLDGSPGHVLPTPRHASTSCSQLHYAAVDALVTHKRAHAGLHQPEVPASRMSPAEEARPDGHVHACSRLGPGKGPAASRTPSADDQSAVSRSWCQAA